MRLRPTSILKYEECPRRYLYQEVLKIQPLVRSANLPFGGLIHKPITDWLIAESLGNPLPTPQELGDQFRSLWQAQTQKEAMEFSSVLGPDDLPETGAALVQQFAERWPSMDLSVVVDDQMQPVVEKRMEVDIGGGLILSTQPDIVVASPEGLIAPLDLKTAAQEAGSAFIDKADQLTAQQIVVEAHADNLLIHSVDRVGFLEMLKKRIPKTKQGEGPQVRSPKFVRARTEAEKQEYLQKVFWVAEDIDRGRFPARPRMAYNSPCEMCEFHGLCKNGDTTGLRIPEWNEQQRRLAA